MINEIHVTLDAVLERAKDLLRRNYIIVGIEAWRGNWKLQACPTTSHERERRASYG